MDNWRQIVESNIQPLVASVRRIVGNDHDAEDVVQEVFAEAYLLAQKKQVDHWPALLRTMAQRRAIDQLRRTMRNNCSTNSESMNWVPSDQDAPSETSEASDLQNLLRQSLTKLSDREAAVFSLAYFDSLSRSEIAATLQTSENAVSVALHKASKRLKDLLQDTNQTDRTD